MQDHAEKSQPLVSVAVITYNQQDIIVSTLSSVVNQTYDNIEIVIGDDASSDETFDIVETYLLKAGKPFKLIRHDINIGITRNLNSVLAACQGDYIALLGGDDQWISNKLETCIPILEAHPEVCFLAHGSSIIDIDGKHTGRDQVPAHSETIITAQDAIEGRIRFFGSAQILRNVANLPKLDVRVPCAGDLLHVVCVLNEVGPAIAIPDCLTLYRESLAGVTLSKGDEVREDGLVGLAILSLMYPKLAKSALTRMGAIYYSAALQCERAGDVSGAMRLYSASLRLNFRFRPIYRIFVVLAGKLFSNFH